MENNMETTQGDHPQVPPAKLPDQDDGQPNEEVPVNGAYVLNEAMSEDTSLRKKPETSSMTAGKKKRNKTNGSVKSRHPKTSRVR